MEPLFSDKDPHRFSPPMKIDDRTRAVAQEHGVIHGLEFLIWWHGDKERHKCTLPQAMGAYVQSFPGRALPLLIELMEGVIEASPLLQMVQKMHYDEFEP